jgi:hypothetical protein
MREVNEQPIACALSTAEMEPRLRRIRQLTSKHLRGYRLDGATLRLSYDARAMGEVASIIELERECCGFLDFRLCRSAKAAELLIVGPEQASADAQWLFAHFLPESPPVSPTCACSRS